MKGRVNHKVMKCMIVLITTLVVSGYVTADLFNEFSKSDKVSNVSDKSSNSGKVMKINRKSDAKFFPNYEVHYFEGYIGAHIVIPENDEGTLLIFNLPFPVKGGSIEWSDDGKDWVNVLIDEEVSVGWQVSNFMDMLIVRFPHIDPEVMMSSYGSKMFRLHLIVSPNDRAQFASREPLPNQLK